MRRVFLLFAAALPFVPGVAWPQGDPLGPEFRINTYTTDVQRAASVASDSVGNFVVVWKSFALDPYGGQDGSGSGIFGQRYDSSGSPLGSEFRVNTYTTGNQDDPSIASEPAGNFVVVWQSEQEGSSNGIFGQRYAGSGAPLGPEFRINIFTTSNQFRPAVAADSSGNFVVIWTSSGQDGSSLGVFGQRYASSGTPVGTEFRVNTYTTGNQFAPALASDSSGNFVVTWNGDGPLGSGVSAQRYSNSGTPLGPEFTVNTYAPNGQSLPSVAADPAGNFVVVWDSYGQDGSGLGVFGQRYANSGTPLGPEFRVNTYTTGSQYVPDVATDPAGNFVVVWHGSEGSAAFDISGQRYSSSGTPVGTEFRINTYAAYDQVRPSTSADSSGNFVVVWYSYQQDGSLVGVYGQRFGQIVPVELMRFGVE